MNNGISLYLINCKMFEPVRIINTESEPVSGPESVEAETDNVFSEPWDDSDAVLVVEDKEFHVHRCILSLQSPVFKAMFNGSFKDSTQEKIELKDDKHEAMLLFLQLLYPPNMLNEDYGKVDINDENVLSIVELADKYGAKNVMKQCLREVGNLEPENTMRLLPYAARHKLSVEKILDVIARHISTDTLKMFAPELGSESVHIKTLETKCRVQEDAIKQANAVMLYLLNKYVTSERDKNRNNTPVVCAQHSLDVEDLEQTRKCNNCLMTYKRSFIDRYVQRREYRTTCGPLKSSMELIELLWLTEDIATSLQK